MSERPKRTLNELRKACTKRGWQLIPIDTKTWRIVDEGHDSRIGSRAEIAEFLDDPIGVRSRTFR